MESMGAPPSNVFKARAVSMNDSLPEREGAPMRKRTAPAITVTSQDLNICCDVGMDEIHVVCPPLEPSSFSRAFTMANRTDAIRTELEQLRGRAGSVCFKRLQIVVEPTGIYHQLLTRIARDLGYRTALVNAE